MTLPIQDAHIDVHTGYDQDPSDDQTPDFTIPGEDIQSAEISERVDEVMDEGQFSIWNHDGAYTSGTELQSGDRIEFRAPMGQQVPYGNGWYGGGVYGGTAPVSWTGRVVTTEDTRETYSRGTVDIEAVDYVSQILSQRTITNSYLGEDVGSIIRDICRRKAPEVDASNIPDLGVSTDIKYSARGCFDAILKLAARADATVIPSGMELHINPISQLPESVDIGPEDYYTPVSSSTNNDIKNTIRINSGENRALEAQQEDIGPNYKKITESTRITKQLPARKSQIHSVELYIDRLRKDGETSSTEEPGDSLRVRLQSSENGEPIAINDSDSDIASTSWGYDNLPDGGWKAFFFDEHTLADRDPWLIVETDGSTGHNVARSSSGELAFRSFYPHPLNFEVQSTESIRQYGPREKRIERDTLKTLTATRDVAMAELARRAWPSKTVEFQVLSSRGHFLAPGDKTNISVPNSDLSGEYIITDVTRTWDSESVTMETNISAQWRKGVLAEVD